LAIPNIPGLARAVVIPMCLITVAAFVAPLTPLKYRFAEYALFVFIGAVYAAVAIGGRVRSTATLFASLALGLCCIEFFGAAGAIQNTSSASTPTLREFYASHPVLGWGPAKPGIYHFYKLDHNGAVIYDVDYTIDALHLRRTLSAPAGPTVAFFGDSFTFGEGMKDEDTLPQAFADIDQRRLHVLNFGLSGYGPQQFLRAIETGLYDNLLTEAKVFVFQTSAWHAERSSCLAYYALRAPRYELRDGVPVHTGRCDSGLVGRVKEFFADVALYKKFLEPVLLSIDARDIDLYIAEIVRAAELARERYGVPTVVLYVPAGDAYLAKVGATDGEIEARLRAGGLLVLDGRLSASNFPPGTMLEIPGDGHPTAPAYYARARLLHDFLKKNLREVMQPSASN
jgi:hypothetical protein